MEAEAVRDRVEVKVSRRLHTASSSADGRHAASAVCRGGQQQTRASGRGRKPRGRGPGHGHARASAWGERGPASTAGPEVGRRPVKVGNSFFFSKYNSRFYYLIQIQILKMKKSFSQIAPKTKVVQNFILYNFHLGHFLKF
jgi:hypothetical protein